MNLTSTQSIREDFILNPAIHYLNHGSFGATPLPVFEEYQRWQRELEYQPTEFLGRRAPELLAASRQILAEYLGISINDLVYITNATIGLNAVARSLDLGLGDEVLSTDHEYGALDRTWRYLAQKQGFCYTNQPIHVPVISPEKFIEELWQGVTPRTKVIFLSHITSPTALIFPVEQVCRRARQEGIITVVDGAHAPGQLPLNLTELGADFYAGNLHKWLCAPKGSAFLAIRPEHQTAVQPLVVSWGWMSDNSTSSQLINALEWVGTRDISAFLSVPKAIAYQREHNWAMIRDACHDLTCDARRRVSDITGLDPLSPDSSEWFGQMISLPLPAHLDGIELHRRLYDEYSIEAPILQWKDHLLLRCSFQAYNGPEDVLALESAVRQLLA